MPALHVFGRRWNASTDSFSLYALLLLIYHVVWVFMYWIGIVAFTAPSRCPDGPTSPQEYVAVYVMLFVFIAWMVLAAAMLIISLRGSPLEPSKRRSLIPLIYVYFLSWIPGFGVLGYAVYVLYGVKDTCWASGSISMIALMVFGAMGIIAGVAFTLLTTHLLAGEVRPGVKWHLVKKGVSTCVGAYTWLLHRHRGPVPPLEELATEYLDRHGNALDLDKTDVVAALLCARLLQRERREALMRARLEASGQLAAVADPAAAPDHCTTNDTSAEGPCDGNDGSEGGMELARWIQAVCKGSGVVLTPSAAALKLAPQLTSKEAADICTDSLEQADEATLREALRWARYAAAAYGKQGYLWTAEGKGGLAARRHLSQLAKQAQRGGKLPQRPAGQAPSSKKLAEEYAAAQAVLGLADRDILYMSPGDEQQGRLAYFIALDRERQRMVLSISGQRQYAPMAAEPTTLPPDWAPAEAKTEGAAGHAVHAGALAAAQQLLEDLETHRLLHSLLPRSSPTVPAGGDGHMQPPTQQQMGTAAPAAAAGSADGGAPIAATCLSAKVAPAAGDAISSGGAGAAAAVDAEVAAGAGDSAGAGGLPRCAGWGLVLTGHGQGAGAAVLLGAKLQQQHPGLCVWAFDPPGGLCAPALSAALAPSTASVLLGKDAVPRTSPDTVAGLIAEGLVGLARFRYNKGLMLVALLAEKAGPRSWRGKWLNPGRALRRPEEIPQEARAYLARFYAAQQAEPKGAGAGAPPIPSTCLPGRVLYLRRLKPLPGQQLGAESVQHAKQQEGDPSVAQQGSVHSTGPSATAAAAGRMEAGSAHSMPSSEHGSDSASRPGCCGGVCGGCIPLCGGKDSPGRRSHKSWDAVWVSPEAVVAEGILVSKRSMHDHYISRLLSVLRRLA